MFLKNINVDVFDDVLQNAKHRANDASSDVNRPPLTLTRLECAGKQSRTRFSWMGFVEICEAGFAN